MAKILCTVNDTGERIDVSVNCDGTVKHFLIAFSAIAKELSKDGIPTSLLVSAVLAKDALLSKKDKDGGAG